MQLLVVLLPPPAIQSEVAQSTWHPASRWSNRCRCLGVLFFAMSFYRWRHDASDTWSHRREQFFALLNRQRITYLICATCLFSLFILLFCHFALNFCLRIGIDWLLCFPIVGTNIRVDGPCAGKTRYRFVLEFLCVQTEENKITRKKKIKSKYHGTASDVNCRPFRCCTSGIHRLFASASATASFN